MSASRNVPLLTLELDSSGFDWKQLFELLDKCEEIEIAARELRRSNPRMDAVAVFSERLAIADNAVAEELLRALTPILERAVRLQSRKLLDSLLEQGLAEAGRYAVARVELEVKP